MGNILQTMLEGFSPGGIQGFQGRQTDQDYKKQQIEANKQRTAQEAETFNVKALHDYMDQGAIPLGPGDVFRKPVVNQGTPEEGYAPSVGYEPTSAADSPGFIISHKSPQGHEFRLYQPTPAELSQNSAVQQFANAMNPNRQAAVAKTQQETAAGKQAENRAGALGTGQGQQQAKIADTAQRGVAVPDDLADQYGIPRGSIRTPEQIDALTEKFNTVRGTQIRTEGAADRQQASIAAKASGVKSTHVTVGKDGTQSLLTIYNNGETEESPMEAKAAPPKTAGAGGLTAGQQGVQSRFQQRQIQADAANHEKLQSKEQEFWSQKGELGDALSVPDGQPFVNPGAGKNAQPTLMSPAWRTILTARQKAIETQALLAQKNAASIRKKNGWGEFGKSEQAPAETGGTPEPTPGGPTIAAPKVTAPAQRVHVKTAKGMGYIPKANLAAAQKLDPTLQVIP